MKVRNLAGIVLVLFVIGGFIFAETETTEQTEKAEQSQVKQQDLSTRSVTARGVRMDRNQMMRERMKKQVEVHQAALKELEDIKKIAEEEGATKTVAALQKLIDEKDAKFKEDLQKIEKARREREKKLKEKVEAQAQKKASEAENKTEEAVEDETEKTVENKVEEE